MKDFEKEIILFVAGRTGVGIVQSVERGAVELTAFSRGGQLVGRLRICNGAVEYKETERFATDQTGKNTLREEANEFGKWKTNGNQLEGCNSIKGRVLLTVAFENGQIMPSR